MLTSSTYFYKYTVEKSTNNTLTLNQNNYQTLISAEFNKKKSEDSEVTRVLEYPWL